MIGRILVVEDSAEIREPLIEFLSAEGYEVTGASNGKAALEVLAQGLSPGLILLDLMMPIMTGYEFLEIRANDERLSAIPVVVLSAVADRSKVQGSTIAAFVKKPIDLDTLLASVKRYCTKG